MTKARRWIIVSALAIAIGALPLSGAGGTPAASTGPAGCAEPAHAGGYWERPGADLRNSRHQDGLSPTPAEAAALEPAWTFSVRGSGGRGDVTGTPVVAGRCVFVGTNGGWAFALDADTGAPRWQLDVRDALGLTAADGGAAINDSAAVAGDLVLFAISREGAPTVVALDTRTGAVRWDAVIDEQPGADAFASPQVVGDVVLMGVSGDAAQHDEADVRTRFHGSMVLLDLGSGALLERIWTIPPEEWDEGHAGATVSTTAAADDAGHAYVGTSSPYDPAVAHPHSDALLKVDVDPERETFGQIVAAMKGDTIDTVIPGYSDTDCVPLPIPPPPAIVPTGRGIGACGDIDVDFGAPPTLIGEGDRQRVAAVQKSGAVHAAFTGDLGRAWRTEIAPAQPFGGVAATWDGQRLVTGASPPGQLIALSEDGEQLWTAPVADGAHYGIPVASGGGVVWTMGLHGALLGVDAEDGTVVAAHPLVASDPRLPLRQPSMAVASFGGVSVARGTVFATLGVQITGLDPTGELDGRVVAYR